MIWANDFVLDGIEKTYAVIEKKNSSIFCHSKPRPITISKDKYSIWKWLTLHIVDNALLTNYSFEDETEGKNKRLLSWLEAEKASGKCRQDCRN